MRQTLQRVDSKTQEKFNVDGTRLKTPWKEWMHIDLCESPERKKKPRLPLSAVA